jgi:hypothetical protein
MADRRPIKRSHERAIVREFLAWRNKKRGTKYSVIREPDPPDALIRSTKRTRWIEVADVFWTDAYAKDRYSQVTPGEKYKPMGRGPYMNMDMIFASRFVNVLKKKLSNKSYARFHEMYGLGILVLCMNHPWFDLHTVKLMKERCRQDTVEHGCGHIGEIYIMYSSLNRACFQKWFLPNDWMRPIGHKRPLADSGTNLERND